MYRNDCMNKCMEHGLLNALIYFHGETVIIIAQSIITSPSVGIYKIKKKIIFVRNKMTRHRYKRVL